MSTAKDPGFGLGTEEVKRRHVLPKALLVGLAAGIGGASFRLGLQLVEHWRLGATSSGLFGLAMALVIGALGGGAGLWMVRRYAEEAAGSGIPQLKAVMLGTTTLRWKRLLPVKFIAGLLGIGGGMALGREGPTIQIGGCTGLLVSALYRVTPGEGERKALISAGAGAGLAAAFNAPLAGVIFVLEELQVTFTPVVFVAVFLASVTSDVVTRLMTSEAPVFDLHNMPSPTMSVLPLALLLGLLAGLGGVLFNHCLLASMDLFDRLCRQPPFLVGAVTGALAGMMGWFVPGIAGTGDSIVDQALVGAIAIGWVPVVLVARFGLTMISYGCGAAGGIFVPMFVLGALGGLSFGSVAHLLVPHLAPHAEVFVVLGMGAVFTAIVRAPLTGLVLMIELTGVYDFMLPLLASCLVAYGVAEMLGSKPIYEALRERANALRGQRGDAPPPSPAAPGGADSPPA